MSDYVVIYEQAEDGAWGAYFPDLPGVVAIGATRSEVGERIEEALARIPMISVSEAGRCRRPITRPAP